MILEIKVKDKVVKISVADGRQTFKWLATVVQARVKQYGVLRSSFEKEDYLVTEIQNSDGEVINPSDRLFEHFVEGTGNPQFTAVVATTFPVDEWDNPHMGDFMRTSLVHSEVGVHWVNEIEAWRDSLHKMDDSHYRGERGQANTNIMLQRAQPASSNLIQIGFDFTSEDIESAFDLDWSTMKWDWFHPSDLLKSQLGDVLKRHYALVCNVFAHFCGIGQVGKRYGLTLQEFGHFMHLMHIYNMKTNDDEIEEIFYKTGNISKLGVSTSTKSLKGNGGAVSTNNLFGGTGGNSWPLMTRAHLAQALVCVALNTERRRKAGNLNEESDGAVDTEKELPHHEALASLLDSKVSDFWESITMKYFCYTSEDPIVKKTTMEYYQLLKHVFELCATTDSKFGPRLPVSMYIVMLQEAFMDANTPDGNNNKENSNVNLCVASFLDSQMNPSTPAWELENLVFCEFLEAISRVALKTLDMQKGSTFTDAKRVRLAFNAVSNLRIADVAAAASRSASTAALERVPSTGANDTHGGVDNNTTNSNIRNGYDDTGRKQQSGSGGFGAAYGDAGNMRK